MKIILKEDIANLGYKDDVVEVKSGYGRNYLIPMCKAVIATESALKVLAENQKQRAHKLAKIKADAEALAESLKDKLYRHNLWFSKQYSNRRGSREVGFQRRPQTYRSQRGCEGSWKLQGSLETPQRSFCRNSFRGGF